MLPPHLPANRKIVSKTRSRSRRPAGRSVAAGGEPQRIVLKGALKVQADAPVSTVARMRQEMVRLC